MVKTLHDAALARHGGLQGIREEALLQSAVAAAQATFGGQSPFADLVEVAAAYLYYLARNHAFLDGNKRTAMLTAIVFLRINGLQTAADGPEWEALMVDVGASLLDRDRTTERLRALVILPTNETP
ncbi:type II toxin-antitoxin system death-on-curing family toxin [Stagnimonas aquatica]|uniref:Type II toxin-antitoxin system death-on-curing family toxin n=1 Tax=Stagnimonas aquatica TaxID=2689987 RepID=A0A3N0V5P2_9GAMM|nr:type II toxin-antitoxin system death-on-curing family toxin [Stagnimonas aquatica]